ncbi:hypothetical protein GA0115244_127947 [Streptomyces sp. DvalAA-19]|nr:hypothetical protein GA0115244_127947 [Streptomyces sp. DvalAA-19]
MRVSWAVAPVVRFTGRSSGSAIRYGLGVACGAQVTSRRSVFPVSR